MTFTTAQTNPHKRRKLTSSPARLLTIPRELRDHILGYLVVSSDPISPCPNRFSVKGSMRKDICGYRIRKPHELDFGIFAVCKQLYYEATEVFTRQNIVDIHILPDVIDILGYRIPKRTSFGPGHKGFEDACRFRKFIVTVHPHTLRSACNLSQISKLKGLLRSESLVVRRDKHNEDVVEPCYIKVLELLLESLGVSRITHELFDATLMHDTTFLEQATETRLRATLSDWSESIWLSVCGDEMYNSCNKILTRMKRAVNEQNLKDWQEAKKGFEDLNSMRDELVFGSLNGFF